MLKNAENPVTFAGQRSRWPTIVIVGRPNVGKSTLFNRLVGSRRSIVGDEPGITRDRLYGEFDWRGHHIRVVDTGGIIPSEKELITAEIFRQARVALDEADVVVMVVDGRSEIAAPDLELARMLLHSGEPQFLAVNKIDTEKQESLVEEFRRLGLHNIFPVSAEHGRGVAELLDAIVDVLPEPPPASEEDQEESVLHRSPEEAAETRVAIIGHPNVGKSTLLNRLTGTSRAIVSPVPGTTRDAVDELVNHNGRLYRFVDTAGIRRKGKTHLMAEKLSVVMSRKHLDTADIALLMIDATEGVSALDANIAGYAHEGGRSVIIVINKWDLVSGPKAAGSSAKSPRDANRRRGRAALVDGVARRSEYEAEVRLALKFLQYAPLIFISAHTGYNVEKVFDALDLVAAERRKRIPTSAMNRFLEKIDFDRASVPASKRVRIYYMTQAATAPPTFILFTDRAVRLHFAYQRFLENQIRREFGFVGTPIWIKNRARE